MAHIVVGVTGSVAAIRTPALVDALRLQGHDARVVATEPALYFFDPAAIAAPATEAASPIGRVSLLRDADEWPRLPSGIYQRDDPVLHIELRRWADLLVIAPLDANTLAKIALGLSDNLLTCLYRAWDPARPIVLAPAMNTFMWEHPLTRRHLELLSDQRLTTNDQRGDLRSPEAVIERINEQGAGLHLCMPQVKRLACGDEGMGAMAEVDGIVAAVMRLLSARNLDTIAP